MAGSIMDVKKFLATKERPIDSLEFKDFWESLTDEEKVEFKNSLPEGE